MDRWMLVEVFKGNRKITPEFIALIEKMDAEEAKEAIIEVLLMMMRAGR